MPGRPQGRPGFFYFSRANTPRRPAGRLLKKGMIGLIPPKLFTHLGLWMDGIPREGPEQMACDEALLAQIDRPILRIFSWARPWISAGYFTSWKEAQTVRPDLPLCRRWTGGGIVVHDNDFTFTLAVPRREPWAAQRPEESYLQLHQVLAHALASAGFDTILSPRSAAPEASCFAGAVRHDILVDGRKIAGGAQRRNRQGLLHQGSIQEISPCRDFGETLAATLSQEVLRWKPSQTFEEDAALLLASKYANKDFLERA